MNEKRVSGKTCYFLTRRIVLNIGFTKKKIWEIERLEALCGPFWWGKKSPEENFGLKKHCCSTRRVITQGARGGALAKRGKHPRGREGDHLDRTGRRAIATGGARKKKTA